MLTAALAGRVRFGLVVLAMIVCAGATSQVLKPLLATQREFPFGHHMGPIAFPSGHSTAVMSLALGLVIIAPARLRPLAAAVGGLLTVATVYAILVVGAHYPSDVLGGFLVATGWACLASAALRLETRPSLSGAALTATALGTAGALAILQWPNEAFAYAEANTTFVAGAIAIATGALVVLSGTVPAPRAVRSRRPSPDWPRGRG